MRCHRHHIIEKTSLLALVAAFGFGCVAAPPEGEVEPLETQRPALIEDGSPEAIGLLEFLNAETTTFEILDDEVPLDRRAAANLVAHRDGPDGVFGTNDDDLFDNVAEVDGVPQVGEATIDRIVDFCMANGWVPDGDDLLGVFDGVPFTVYEAAAVLALVNVAAEVVLDVEIDLDRRAVASILEARPIDSVLQLSELYYVGGTALEKLKAASVAGEQPARPEIGIISDLDRTVIPPHRGELPEQPYPGVAALYNALEHRDGGEPGDTYFVTARQPEAMTGIPEWLEQHGLPDGPIDTGVSGIPWVAQAEKVSDFSEVIDANPDQTFVLFGDSNHVDADVFAEVMGLYPGRITLALVHRVSVIDDAELGPNILVHDNYAHAAALLLGRGVIDESAARGVMHAAQSMGLEITDSEIDNLINESSP